MPALRPSAIVSARSGKTLPVRWVRLHSRVTEGLRENVLRGNIQSMRIVFVAALLLTARQCIAHADPFGEPRPHVTANQDGSFTVTFNYQIGEGQSRMRMMLGADGKEVVPRQANFDRRAVATSACSGHCRRVRSVLRHDAIVVSTVTESHRAPRHREPDHEHREF
jgi:hypothetical protein